MAVGSGEKWKGEGWDRRRLKGSLRWEAQGSRSGREGGQEAAGGWPGREGGREGRGRGGDRGRGVCKPAKFVKGGEELKTGNLCVEFAR